MKWILPLLLLCACSIRAPDRWWVSSFYSQGDYLGSDNAAYLTSQVGKDQGVEFGFMWTADGDPERQLVMRLVNARESAKAFTDELTKWLDQTWKEYLIAFGTQREPEKDPKPDGEKDHPDDDFHKALDVIEAWARLDWLSKILLATLAMAALVVIGMVLYKKRGKLPFVGRWFNDDISKPR